MRCLSFLDSALRSLFRQPAVDTLLGGPGFVPVEVVEQDGVTGYRVGGVAMANSQEFRQAVRTTMQLVTDSVSGQHLAISGQVLASQDSDWDFNDVKVAVSLA